LRVEFEVELFDIFFRHFLRLENVTYEQYAEKMGMQVESVKRMAEGRLPPSDRVLKDMNAKLVEVRNDYIVWYRGFEA